MDDDIMTGHIATLKSDDVTNRLWELGMTEIIVTSWYTYIFKRHFEIVSIVLYYSSCKPIILINFYQFKYQF